PTGPRTIGGSRHARRRGRPSRPRRNSPPAARYASSSSSLSLPLYVRQEVQHVVVELLWILQEREVADSRLKQHCGIRNLVGHEQRVLPLDRLVVIGVDDPGWRLDARELLLGEVRLCRPHLADLVEKGFVLGGRGREFLVFLFSPGDISVEHWALAD